MKRLSASLIGTWRITSMDQWGQADVEEMGPALLEIKPDCHGEINFLCVNAGLDCAPTMRDGRPALEFSWEGFDDCDARCGRGWVRLGENPDTLEGMFCFHMGDRSGFKAARSMEVIALKKAGGKRRGARA